MFTKIKLKNFRSFGEIEFDLSSKNGTPKNFAVIFGENGAGKSNLISAFVFLHEIFSTMNIRDIYEELLNERAVYIDENMEIKRKEFLKAGLRDMHAIIADYKMVECEEPITAEFEFQINGNNGKYMISLNEDEIIYEKLEFMLNKRKGIYFECSADGTVNINNAIIKDKEFMSDIKFAAKRFWGKHSIFAIILHEIMDKSKSYGADNISENFIRVIDHLSMISCYLYRGRNALDRLYSEYEVFESAAAGKLDLENENELTIAENIFTVFFSSINSDIKRVYYERDYNNNLIRYQLVVEKMVAGQYRHIPFSKESTGNHQLLRALCYILSAAQGNIVVIDEADSGIHDFLFLKILQEIVPCIEGQLIMTTHNTMLMEADFSRNATYILREEEAGRKTITAISDFEKRTYASNNIRNKYLHNGYGGLPNVKAIDFKALIKELDNFKEETV